MSTDKFKEFDDKLTFLITEFALENKDCPDLFSIFCSALVQKMSLLGHNVKMDCEELIEKFTKSAKLIYEEMKKLEGEKK